MGALRPVLAAQCVICVCGGIFRGRFSGCALAQKMSCFPGEARPKSRSQKKFTRKSKESGSIRSPILSKSEKSTFSGRFFGSIRSGLIMG